MNASDYMSIHSDVMLCCQEEKLSVRIACQCLKYSYQKGISIHARMHMLPPRALGDILYVEGQFMCCRALLQDSLLTKTLQV